MRRFGKQQSKVLGIRNVLVGKEPGRTLRPGIASPKGGRSCSVHLCTERARIFRQQHTAVVLTHRLNHLKGNNRQMSDEVSPPSRFLVRKGSEGSMVTIGSVKVPQWWEWISRSI